MSTTNCNNYTNCDNSNLTVEQLFKLLVAATENGCPAFRVVIADPEESESGILDRRIQIEGDATAFSEQPCELLGYRIKNTSTSDVWVKLADETDAGTNPGTTEVAWEQMVPANSFVWETVSDVVQHTFQNAMTAWATTVPADTGTQTAPTVDSITVQLYWRVL